MKLNYFNFKKLNQNYLFTNDLGMYASLTTDEFNALIRHKIEPGSDLEQKLIDSAMIYQVSDLSFTSEHFQKLRELKGFMGEATSLHIFVVTTACNQNCIYCQANSGSGYCNSYMDEQTAEKAARIALQSPNKYLNFEFQGGEPLLNWKIVRHIIEYTEAHKGQHVVRYNIVSNLTLISDDIIHTIKEYDIGVSTSLDGPEFLHNRNRPSHSLSSPYNYVYNAIKRLRDHAISVGAIQTTTRYSLPFPQEIVRTYIDLGFDSIFIRSLTPLGKAKDSWDELGYSAEEFLSFYQNIIDELIQANLDGYRIREVTASIFLNRIRGGAVNYMELRSPCGAGIGQLAYYADGRIFTCDEGRMLAEMGDSSFQLGNVNTDTYESLMKNGVCRTVCAASTLETIPGCCDCVYLPYCGTCPVISYASTGDVLEKSPHSYKCKINEGILDYIFNFLLDEDTQGFKILNDWCDCK